MLDICPKCKDESYIKVPGARWYKSFFGTEVYEGSDYYYKCLNDKCQHRSEKMFEKPERKESKIDKFITKLIRKIF